MSSARPSGEQPKVAPVFFERVPARRLLNPLFFLASLWDLGVAWAFSRPWWALGAGLPAILGFLLAIVVWVLTSETQASRFTWRYRTALQEARRDKNKEAESLWQRALMESDPQNQEYRFQWALRCSEEGLNDQAQRVMAELASGPAGGYVPAHLWLAKSLLKQTQPTEANSRKAIRHLEAVLAVVPQSPDANAQLAQVYLKLGQSDKAEPYLTKGVQWFPHLRVPLAQILASRQNMDTARWQLQQASEEIRAWLKKKPEDVESRLSLADALQLLGQPEAAEEVMIQAEDTTDARVRDRLARTSIAKAARLRWSQLAADRDKRRTFILTALRFDPTSPAVLEELTLLLTDGVALDKKVRDQLEADFNKQLGENSQQPQLHLLLGLVMLQGNRARPAVEQLTIAAKQSPRYGVQLGRVLRQLGQDQAAQQQLESSAARLHQAVAAKPDDLSLRMALAEAETELKHWPEAREVLRDGYAASKDPRYLQAVSQIIVSQHDASRAAGEPQQRQLELLRESLKAWPESPFALSRLSELTLRTDPLGEQAREELGKLRSSASRSQVLQLLGVAAASLGKSDLALEYFTHVACLEVRDPFIQNNLAFALADREKPDLQRALELADSALQKSPDQPEFRATRGVVYLKLKRWSDAEKDLNVALSAGLDRADIHAALATVYDQLKQPDLAKPHREKATPKKPEPKK